MTLQLAIAFFGFSVAAWAGMGFYIRNAAAQRRAAATVAIDLEPIAQAA